MRGSTEVVEIPTLRVGNTVVNRFVLVRPLGRGSMGSVWLARHQFLDIDVALKFIDARLTDHPNYVERFRREACAAAQIVSPHVVRVLDYGADETGAPFMAMEYLNGATLGVLLKREPRQSVQVVERLVRHAALGLARAHAQGVIHRDIKPENLFLCREGTSERFTLKILDFGVARATHTSSGCGTLAGQLVGSPAYMSPEQARGSKSLDARTDLFSLAVVAYQCLTGAHPFEGRGLGELLAAICSGGFQPPSSVVPGLPRAIDGWFAKALAKLPEDRFTDAETMSRALAEALSHGHAPEPGTSGSSSVEPSSVEPQSAEPQSTEPQSTERESKVRESTERHSTERATRPRAPLDSTDFGHSLELRSGVLAMDESDSDLPFVKKLGTVIPALERDLPRIDPATIAQALTPLAVVPETLGVALLDPKGDCLASRARNGQTQMFTSVFAHARTVADTLESLDGARAPGHLCVRFEQRAVYVRWMSSFALVVVGTAQLRPLLLTVGSNKLADRLELLVAQTGGVEATARLLRQARPDGQDSSDPPHALQRGSAQQEETADENLFATDAEEPPTKKERPIVYRGRVLFNRPAERADARLSARRNNESITTRPPLASSAPEFAALDEEPPTRRDRPLVYRGKVIQRSDTRRDER